MPKIKDKLNKKTLVLITIAILIILTIIFVVLSYDNQNVIIDDSPNITLPDSGNMDKPDENENVEKITVDLVEYDYYEFDDVEFGFIISKFRFKSDEPINMKLDTFVTSENIVLSDVESYVTKLEAKSYYLGKQNVFFEVISQEGSTFVNVFIPVIDKASSEISLKINSKNFTYDISKSSDNKDLFIYESDDIITDGKTYQMAVSNAFEITGEQFERVYDDGFSEEYVFSSTARLYAFKLDVVSLWGDEVEIESAVYIVDGTNDGFEALGENIKPQKYDNIIGSKIYDKTTGTIIIPTYSNNEDALSFKGKLKLKLSNSDNYIEIKVDL